MRRDEVGIHFAHQSLTDQAFDSGEQFDLIRTDQGAVFKLGNPSEDDAGLTFSYERVQEVSP